MRAETSRRPRQIFVSYSRADRVAIDRFCADLERHNHDLWVDTADHGIEAGENWRDELVKQVSGSQALIACLSPDYFKSEFCRAEVAQALAEGKPVYPVKIRRLTPDEENAGLAAIQLSDVQYIDLSTTVDAYAAGLRRLRRKLPNPPLISMPRLLNLARALMVVLVLAGVFALGGVAAIVASTPAPSVSGHTIGVVVAQFAGPADGSVDGAESAEVALRFSNLLRQELDGALKPLRLTYGFLGPADGIGEVQGDLRDFAAKYGADVVIYGQISRNDTGELIVEPRFYLNPDTFTDAMEMVGASRFGAPVRLVNLRGGTAEQALSARSVTLTQTVIGLSRYLLGDYGGALAAFEQAQATASRDGEEIEVVLAMLGSTRLKIAAGSLARGDAASAAPLLDAAEQAYREALALDAEYARAYTGLAAANYLQWNAARQQGESPNVDVLNDALGALAQAESAIQQPNLIYQTRALLPRLQIQYARWINYPADIDPVEYDAIPDDIITTAARILTFYEDGTQPAVQDVAAEAYKFLGLVAYGLGDCQTAIDSYAKGIAIAEPLNRAYMTGWIADCEAELGDNTAAIARYQEALTLAIAAEAPPALIARYGDRIAELDSRG